MGGLGGDGPDFSASDYNSGGDGWGGNGWSGASNSHQGGGGKGSLDNLHAIRGWDTPMITDVKQNTITNCLNNKVTTSVTVTTMFNGETTTETYYEAGYKGKALANAARGLKGAFSAFDGHTFLSDLTTQSALTAALLGLCPAEGPFGETLFGSVSFGAFSLDAMLYSQNIYHDLFVDAFKRATNIHLMGSIGNKFGIHIFNETKNYYFDTQSSQTKPR